MSLSLVTAPAVEPVSLAEAKLHLRVDIDDENDLIDTLITAAREYVETFTHRALITQTYDLKLDDFPTSWSSTGRDLEQVSEGAIWLCPPPVSSVTSITYVDTNGATQTWSAALYTTDLPAGPKARPGRVLPAFSQWYPVMRSVANAVTVRFVAGYGATGATVPNALKAAMKLLIGNWWLNREAGQIVRGSADVLPFGIDALLWPFKAF